MKLSELTHADHPHLAHQEGRGARLGGEHRVRRAVEEGDVEVEEVAELLAPRADRQQGGHQVGDGEHGDHLISNELLCVLESGLSLVNTANTFL